MCPITLELTENVTGTAQLQLDADDVPSYSQVEGAPLSIHSIVISVG